MMAECNDLGIETPKQTRSLIESTSFKSSAFTFSTTAFEPRMVTTSAVSGDAPGRGNRTARASAVASARWTSSRTVGGIVSHRLDPAVLVDVLFAPPLPMSTW